MYPILKSSMFISRRNLIKQSQSIRTSSVLSTISFYKNNFILSFFLALASVFLYAYYDGHHLFISFTSHLQYNYLLV